MASPTANKTSWKNKIARRISGHSKNINGLSSSPGSSFEDNLSLDEFEAITLDEVFNKSEGIGEDWEVLTLAKQQKNNRHRHMDSNHTDGVPVQGGNNKSYRKVSGNNAKLVSPILSRGGLKSALKQDKKDMDIRPASAGANSQRSTSNNRRKLLTTPDSYLGSNRTPSPNVERKSSFKRNKGIGSSGKESSPNELDSINSSGSNFSKLRDTLKIRKGKKKSTKVAQYSVPELNFPMKYEDPFEVNADFSDNSTEVTGHEFIVVDVPHHKPEYCDHCQGAAWGHNQTLKCTSKLREIRGCGLVKD